MRELTYIKSAVRRRLDEFGGAVKVSPPSLSRNKQLIFLCGANSAPGTPSPRREALKKYIQGISGDYSVIYAESVFNELIKVGHLKNALDLEHEISDIADKIIIVLESESAFCELGAFAHQALRKKLIVINDSQFREGQSFINTGPLAAMAEVKSPTLWYPMSNIRSKVDGIGAVFFELKEALSVKPRKSTLKTDFSELNTDKSSLYFIHDLVLFAGAISYKELVQILVTLFGDKRYDLLHRLLGILRAAGLITNYMVEKNRIYRTVGRTPFLSYASDTNALMSTFRSTLIKSYPERFSLG